MPRSAARKAQAYPPGPAPITTNSTEVVIVLTLDQQETRVCQRFAKCCHKLRCISTIDDAVVVAHIERCHRCRSELRSIPHWRHASASNSQNCNFWWVYDWRECCATDTTEITDGHGGSDHFIG